MTDSLKLMIQTATTQLLDNAGVTYTRLPHSKQVFTIEEAAAERGVVADEMVKSILLRDKDRNYAMACLLGYDRLDPQAVRRFLGDPYRRLTFASAAEIEATIGYIKGAVNPLGLSGEIPVVFDERIRTKSRVNISSGDHLLGLELDATDLIRLSGARFAPITKE